MREGRLCLRLSKAASVNCTGELNLMQSASQSFSWSSATESHRACESIPAKTATPLCKFSSNRNRNGNPSTPSAMASPKTAASLDVSAQSHISFSVFRRVFGSSGSCARVCNRNTWNQFPISPYDAILVELFHNLCLWLERGDCCKLLGLCLKSEWELCVYEKAIFSMSILGFWPIFGIAEDI